VLFSLGRRASRSLQDAVVRKVTVIEG
jgi:hypothetical protein